jgi:peroxiredoxin family protein
LKKIALIVSRGSFNNFIQVATLIRALTSSTDTSVRVFFRDEALLKLTRGRINEPNFSEAYIGIEERTLTRLQAAEFDDLESFFRESKEHGDQVKFYACASSMFICGLNEEDLTPLVDSVRSLTDFLHQDVDEADTIMTF